MKISDAVRKVSNDVWKVSGGFRKSQRVSGRCQVGFWMVSYGVMKVSGYARNVSDGVGNLSDGVKKVSN